MVGEFFKSVFGIKTEVTEPSGSVGIDVSRELAAAKNRIAELERENYDLCVVNQNLKNKQTTMSDTIPDNTNDIDNLNSQVRILTGEIEHLKAQNCDIIREKSKAIENMKKQIATSHKESEQAFVNLRNNHKTEMQKASRESANQILALDKKVKTLEAKYCKTKIANGVDVSVYIEKEKKRVTETSKPTGTRSLTDDQVRDIRKKINVDKVVPKKVAEEYNLHVGTISRCASCKTYQDVK